MDAEHVWKLSASVPGLCCVVRVFCECIVQAGDQVFVKLVHWLGIDEVVNDLVRDAELIALGVDVRQCQGNLFGRPALSQQILHDDRNDSVRMQFSDRVALSAVTLAALLSSGTVVLAG